MNLARAAALLVSVLALMIAGCPPSGSGQKPATVCTKEGESCTFAPGKLGMCVAKPAPCASDAASSGESCFVCQSQH